MDNWPKGLPRPNFHIDAMAAVERYGVGVLVPELCSVRIRAITAIEDGMACIRFENWPDKVIGTRDPWPRPPIRIP